MHLQTGSSSDSARTRGTATNSMLRGPGELALCMRYDRWFCHCKPTWTRRDLPLVELGGSFSSQVRMQAYRDRHAVAIASAVPHTMHAACTI